ncbi:MAG: hypothetical protein HYW33_00965 [Candidatus Blackburnbacteria bacterium]|nr:hypothetical protein [Candidatus Blackburnbacteria bacterium]
MKDEEKLTIFFVKAFKDVVLPVLEDMHNDIKELKEITERSERKLDRHEDRLDEQGQQLESHKEQLELLKTAAHN